MWWRGRMLQAKPHQATRTAPEAGVVDRAKSQLQLMRPLRLSQCTSMLLLYHPCTP